MKSRLCPRLIFFAIFFLPAYFFDCRTGICARQEVELEPIVVIQKDADTGYALPTKGVNEVYIKEPAIETPEEALDYEPQIDIMRRSVLGTQSDITIRGATPEETAVAVNGIQLNNPQTAHHNLDIGIPSGLIERIDISPAASVSSWSQGAMGGGINVVTKKPLEDKTGASFLYGTDATQKGCLDLSRKKGLFGLGFSIEEVSSDGWRYDTDFKGVSLASQCLADLRDGISSNMLAAYGEKEFGAANFYGPYDSKEWTNTSFLDWSIDVKKGQFRISPKLYFQRHHDKYMLDIKRPDYYINHHRTDNEGFMLETETDIKSFGAVSISADINREKIKSTRLGKDSRSRNSAMLGWKNYRLQEFGYDIFLRINEYSQYKTEALPGAGVFFDLNENIRLRSSMSKSSRTPTYTELFYDSPSDKGDRGLSPEKANNYEIGADIINIKSMTFTCTLFRRDSSDLIGWVKDSPSQSYYQAKNITEVNTEGIEAAADITPLKWFRLKGGYAYMNSDIKKDYNYISKYALNHPAHKATGQAGLILPFGTQYLNLVYKDRKHYSNYFIMGCVNGARGGSRTLMSFGTTVFETVMSSSSITLAP